MEGTDVIHIEVHDTEQHAPDALNVLNSIYRHNVMSYMGLKVSSFIYYTYVLQQFIYELKRLSE